MPGHAGEKWHLVGRGRGLRGGWARSLGLGGSLAEFQSHKESTCRMGEMVFAPSPIGEQVEMLAGMLEVLLDRFKPPRPGPMSAPPGGERAGQGPKRLVEIDVADELKLDVCHRSCSFYYAV